MRERVGRVVGFGVEHNAGPLPYLVELLMPAVYRRCEVPVGLARNDLIAWASDRSVEARRRMCLVFGGDDCVYVEPDGSWVEADEPPTGGVAIEW